MANQADLAFRRLARAMGKKVGGYTKLKSGKLKANIGAWTLNSNPTYGGYVIEQIYNAGGGVTHPLTSRRFPKGAFIAMCNFASSAIDLKRRRK
jgi:hypothetical protein